MTSPRSRTTALVIGLLLVAAGCTSSDGESSDGAVAPITTTEAATTTTSASAETSTTADPVDEVEVAPLEWEPCDAFECATLTVPREYTDPDGEQIEIAVSRKAATDPVNRIGSLVFNPGGPGGSGLEYLEVAVLTIPADVSARFDLVSFDPRGVGASTAVDCDIDFDDMVSLVEEGDDSAWLALLEEERALFATCPADALTLAAHVGTNNAARDLDRLRAGLGDEQLSYVGYSYGTRLGATYAELFPAKVRALVLDGGVFPSSDLTDLDREQASGFDKAFENFAAACDDDPDCILQELGPTIEVFRSIEAEIRSVGGFETDDPDRVLTDGEFYLGVIAALYSADAWPFLAQALYTAETLADGTLLQVLGDSLVGRQPDGSYDNSNEANSFINCADDPNRPPVDDVRQQTFDSAGLTAYFDDLFRAGTGCLTAPDPLDPLIVGPATGAAPILVLGNTGDPATPYEWSVALADSLDSGVLYSVEAEGHTAYGTLECVTPVVNAYLIDLVMPDEGGSCSENATADFFVPAGESDLDKIVAFFACLQDEGVEIGDVTESDILADPTLEKLLGSIDLEDPEVLTAIVACQSLLPQA